MRSEHQFYTSLHNHTEYSNVHVIDSINRPMDMINYAWDLGFSGLAFTDHDCISGAIEELDCYKRKITDEWTKLNPDKEVPSVEEMAAELNFKIMLGNEIYLTAEGVTEETQRENYKNGEKTYFYHYLLVAKDAEGFKQIRQLSSRAWSRGFFYGRMMRTPTYPSDLFEIVKGGHIVCSTACLAGYVARKYNEMVACLDEEQKRAIKQQIDNHLQMMEELFGKGNYYLELQPSEKFDQIDYNKWLINNYWGKYPFIFTTDAHYLKPALREVHKAFLNSRSSGTRDVDEFYGYAYMMAAEEVYGFMKSYITEEQFQEMINNTNRIQQMCSYYTLDQKQVIARVAYEHFDEYKEDLEFFDDVDEQTYPNFYYYLHTDNQADNYLARLIAHGYINKYDETWNSETYYNRLEEELWTIKEVGEKIGQHMSDYFISMAKMIDLMWEAGSIVGPSRGSAGAMLINYLLGITQMNPIELNLPYVWRFMHPSRPDLPDIDVDSESDKRAAVFNNIREYFQSLGGDVVNVCTFGTEGTKSALKTAGRGLNIDDDLITYVTSMIPNERGFDWSLHDCYYGNGEDREGRAAFKQVMDENPMLWEVAQGIEGLVTRLGVHASGVVCLNSPLTDYAGFMKTNKEQLVTCFDLHKLERCGLVKYDLLTVSALDRIHQTMNYMLEDGTLEWQGDLRSTYNKYLSPQVIDYNDKEMWDKAANGEIRSLFQFDTLVGGQAIKQIRPHSLTELAVANSIMRLMGEKGAELPLDKYVKFKTSPQLWYDEMNEYGLNADEVKVLKKYLEGSCGLAESQEVVMELSMDPHISNFTMQEANRLRKTIAKKAFREIENVRQLFYEKGLAAGTRKVLLDYVWKVQIGMSLGYSFSRLHTTGYSIIAVQEMNLAHKWPIIYWNTACLSVDSSAINAQDFYNLVDENIVEIDEVEGKRVQNKMDYAKIAQALDNFRGSGCKVRLPDINESRLGFTPDVKDNSILYGLKGISRVTAPVIEEIMINRPYSSLKDFLNRTTSRIVTKDKVINLIKCGAFDRIEKKDRKEILTDFIWQVCDAKQKLTMQNANMLIDQGLLPPELSYESEVYKLTKELRKHRDKNKLWYIGDALEVPVDKIDIWKQIIVDAGVRGQDLVLDGVPCRVMDSNLWDNFYDRKMLTIKNYIKAHHDELLEKLNNRLFMTEWNKYCNGDELQWELDSVNFYFDGHPLTKVIPQLGIEVNFLEEVVEGAPDGFFLIKGKQIPKMKLYTLAGTVIDRDKVKGLVTLQTVDGVVSLKVYKDLYSTFVAVIGDINENGEKDIEQDSFFEKGVHLLVTGIQRGATFIPKVYKNTGRQAIERIVLDDMGNFVELEEKRSVQNEG